MGKLFKSIKDWYQARKVEIAQGLLLILVAAASFGLGYLIRGDINKAPIIIEQK